MQAICSAALRKRLMLSLSGRKSTDCDSRRHVWPERRMYSQGTYRVQATLDNGTIRTVNISLR